jgi:hypothetical protein
VVHRGSPRKLAGWFTAHRHETDRSGAAAQVVVLRLPRGLTVLEMQGAAALFGRVKVGLGFIIALYYRSST